VIWLLTAVKAAFGMLHSFQVLVQNLAQISMQANSGAEF